MSTLEKLEEKGEEKIIEYILNKDNIRNLPFLKQLPFCAPGVGTALSTIFSNRKDIKSSIDGNKDWGETAVKIGGDVASSCASTIISKGAIFGLVHGVGFALTGPIGIGVEFGLSFLAGKIINEFRK